MNIRIKDVTQSKASEGVGELGRALVVGGMGVDIGIDVIQLEKLVGGMGMNIIIEDVVQSEELEPFLDGCMGVDIKKGS